MNGYNKNGHYNPTTNNPRQNRKNVPYLKYHNLDNAMPHTSLPSPGEWPKKIP
jgi:hypothetical protein